MKNYDVAVIGGGSAGSAAVKQAVRRGANACIIQDSYFGGVCLNVGCMPTKSMLHMSNQYWEMKNTDVPGVELKGKVDGSGYMKKVRDVVVELREKVEKAINSNKDVTIYRGTGRLTGPNSIHVERKDESFDIYADSIVIATGSHAIRPGFAPWRNDRVMISDDAVWTKDLPESIVIVGGGVIGCEFATIYSQFGIETHLVEMGDKLVPSMENKQISDFITESLEASGCNIYLNSKVEAIEETQDGLSVNVAGKRIEVSHVLVSIGRTGNTENIGLEEAGVEVRNGIIPVDDCCRTNIDHIYAAGDVAEKMQYAHLAERMGRVAGDNAAGGSLTDERDIVPVGIYTNPQVAVVKLRDHDYDDSELATMKFPYADSGTARIYGHARGQVLLRYVRESGRIVEAYWCGDHAVDLAHEAVISIKHNLTLGKIFNVIHAHPSIQEIFAEMAESFVNAKMRQNKLMNLSL